MKVYFESVAALLLVIVQSCVTPQQKQPEDPVRIEFVERFPEKRVDVMVDGRLFTAYRWPEQVYKPVLYPLISAGGNTVTRGFPLEPREGERQDHRHQVGNWLNFGNVNGLDFWGNGHSGERSANGGEIRHQRIEQLKAGNGAAGMATWASWVDPDGKELLSEKTRFHFLARDSTRIVDRITTLTATGKDSVRFKDTKEGMFAIRVSRQLELPSEEDVTLTDAAGNPTTVRKMTNDGVTGNYRSSEGLTGEDVWGTRARWMTLYGTMGKEKVALVICDHPDNIGYPTYWHARGYGLFSANPLGVKDFTGGKEELNLSVAPGESITFRFRLVVASHHLTDAEINGLADDFAAEY